VAAAPLACVGTIMKEGMSTRNVTAFGAPEHGPGMPHVSEGKAAAT
jgi:putative ABC transport system permease protein